MSWSNLFEGVAEIFTGGDYDSTKNKADRRISSLEQQINPAQQQQRALLGLEGAKARQQAMADLRTRPDYQFQAEQGQLGIDRGASASGKLGGGGRLRALERYRAGLDAQFTQNQLNNLNAYISPYQAEIAQLRQTPDTWKGAVDTAGDLVVAGTMAYFTGGASLPASAGMMAQNSQNEQLAQSQQRLSGFNTGLQYQPTTQYYTPQLQSQAQPFQYGDYPTLKTNIKLS